ncbi:MAG: sulfatase, partial [Acidobacteriota bacterium]
MTKMIPRSSTLCMVLLLLAMAECACGEAPAGSTGRRAAAGPRPSVLLIVVDTLRRDHLGCYGYPRNTSPAIDGLAAVSTRYTRAFGQAPWTTPSIGSLLSSRAPSFLGIRTVASALPQDLKLIPETLKEAGYTTGAIISHTFCSARWNFNQGFDLFDEKAIVGPDLPTSPQVTKATLAYLDAHAGEPFFLWVHMFDPHNRYLLHPKFDFPPDKPYDGPVRQDWRWKDIRRKLPSMEPRDMQQVIRFYDSEIAFTDHHVSMILDRLRALHLFDDMLIIFTADHGEEFGDHHGMGHTNRLYQELVNVPLIIKYPRSRPAVVDRPVALLDLYPTILETAGLPPRPDLEGISLLHMRKGETPRSIFTETSRGRTLRGVISGKYKFIRDLKSGRTELYDLIKDPGERTNLAREKPNIQATLSQRLEEWMGRQARLMMSAPELHLTDQEIRRLRSLG